MADFTPAGVEMIVKGVAQFNKDMNSADSTISNFGKGAGNATSKIGGFGKAIGGAATVAGGALVAGVGAAAVAIGGIGAAGLSAAADMEQSIANIRSVFSGTAPEVAELNDLILALGVNPNLKVDATEAATAIELLARNGLSWQEIAGGATEATVLLANATGADFGQAADIATDVMSLFGIQADNMITAVDGITSVTTNSKFSVTDYAYALAQGGGVAASVGVSMDDFNTTIAATSSLFASGGDAGTSFKTFLQRLVPASKEATSTMLEIGLATRDVAPAIEFLASKGITPLSNSAEDLETALTMYAMAADLGKRETNNLIDTMLPVQSAFFDANGQMRSMTEISGLMANATAGLSDEQKNQAFSTIFGSDAMRTAFALADTGSEAFSQLQATMGDTSAADSVAIRMDTLSGKWEIFTGILDSVSLQIGNALLPAFKTLADELIDFVSSNESLLIPLFEDIGEFLGDNIPKAIGKAKQFFTNTLKPAMLSVSSFVQGTLIPAFTMLADNLTTKTSIAITRITDIWNTVLFPVFIRTGEFIQGSLIPAFESLSDFIIQNMPTVEQSTNQAWDNIQSILEITTNIITGTVLPVLTDMFEWFQSNMPVIQAVTLTAWEVIQDIITTVSNIITNDIMPNIQEAIENIQQAMSNLGIDWGDNWELMLSVLSVTAQVIGAVILATIATITSIIVAVSDVVVNITESVNTIIAGFNRMKDSINDTFGNMIGFVTNLINGNFTEAFENFKGILSGTIDFVGGATDIILGIFDLTFGSVLTGLGSFVLSFAGFFVDLYNNLIGETESTLSTLIDFFQGGFDNIINFAVAFVIGIVNEFSLMSTRLVDSTVDMIDDIIDAFNSIDWFGITAGIAQDMIDGILSLSNNLIEAFGGIVEGIKNVFFGINWGDIGTNIASSIASGISEKAGDIKRALQDAAQQGVDAVKGLLGISSPSTVFLSIGEEIGNGLILGIQSKSSGVNQSLSGLLDISGSLSSIGKGITGVTQNITQPLRDEQQSLVDELLSSFDEFGVTVVDTGDLFGDIMRTDLSDLPDDIGQSLVEIKSHFANITGEINRLDTQIDRSEGFQNQIGFLEQQSELLDLIAENGLNASDILGDMEFGLDANPVDILRAINDANEVILSQAEQQLLLNSQNTELLEEQAAIAQQQAQLAQAQQQLQFLKDQQKLLTDIAVAGLDPSTILQGFQVGIDASQSEFLQVLTNFTNAMIGQVEDDLGIASPSKVFESIGENVILGLRDGIQSLMSLPANAVQGAISMMTPQSVSASPVMNNQQMTINQTFNNGLDMAAGEAMLNRTLGNALIGV